MSLKRNINFENNSISKKSKPDIDIHILSQSGSSNIFGSYLLCTVIKNGLDPFLTSILQKYFTKSTDGSTFRESFIFVLTSIIGDGDVIDDFLSKFNTKYIITKENEDLSKYIGKRVVFSGDNLDSTHYKSVNPTENFVYNSYETQDQLTESHGFCQIFAIYNAIKDLLPSHIKILLYPYNFTLNSYNALLFCKFILKNTNPKTLQKSLSLIYSQYNNYDLKKNQIINIQIIINIIDLYTEIDIFPTIIDAGLGSEMYYDSNDLVSRYISSRNSSLSSPSMECLQKYSQEDYDDYKKNCIISQNSTYPSSCLSRFFSKLIKLKNSHL